MIFCVVGAIARSGLWQERTFFYKMYYPVCSGNESNILNCRYETTTLNTIDCTNHYWRYDYTSVICLPSK